MYVLGDYVEEYGAVLAGGSVAGWGREGGGGERILVYRYAAGG
jgi:hypothetical protein